jgi:repressor LexA
MPLAKRAVLLFDFIKTYLQENHYGPTFEEMREAIGLKSKSNVKTYLDQLKREKLIDYAERIPRAVWRIQSVIETMRIPIAGSISAGAPIPFINRLDPDTFSEIDFLSLTREQLPKKEYPTWYALRVDGDSMIDANLQDGDWVIVVPPEDIREGDTLAFWLIDEQAMTLKKYYRDGEEILLQPANPKFKTKRKKENQIEVRGKLVHVHRCYE